MALLKKRSNELSSSPSARVSVSLRVGRDELGLAPDACRKLLGKARLMGAWDHFYADSAFNASLSTHYVNLPHWLALTWDEVALLKLPVGEQHSAWQWLPLVNAAQNPLVHPHVQPYAAWGLGVSPAAA
ncbi:MAG: hypothetical protein I8H91_03355 [Burkholderiales bacterium]|nr:hypothetical protein [Burkholderiales bacterium]